MKKNRSAILRLACLIVFSGALARAQIDKQRLPLARARANAFTSDWATYVPPKPTFGR